MLEEQSQQTGSSGGTTRTAIAIVLLALAIPLGIWVLTIVNATIKDKDTERPAILQKIYPEEDKPIDINTPSGKIELPEQILRGFSYTILFMFLLIPTTIAVALLKGCVTLLKPELTAGTIRRLIESIEKIKTPKE